MLHKKSSGERVPYHSRKVPAASSNVNNNEVETERSCLLLNWVNGQDFGGIGTWPVEDFETLSEGRLITKLLGADSAAPLSRALAWIWQSSEIPMELRILTPWEVSNRIYAGDEFIIEQVIGFLYDRDDHKTTAWDVRGQDTVTKPAQVPQSLPRRARPNRPAKSFDGRKKIVLSWLKTIPGCELGIDGRPLSYSEVEKQTACGALLDILACHFENKMIGGCHEEAAYESGFTQRLENLDRVMSIFRKASKSLMSPHLYHAEEVLAGRPDVIWELLGHIRDFYMLRKKHGPAMPSGGSRAPPMVLPDPHRIPESQSLHDPHGFDATATSSSFQAGGQFVPSRPRTNTRNKHRARPTAPGNRKPSRVSAESKSTKFSFDPSSKNFNAMISNTRQEQIIDWFQTMGVAAPPPAKKKLPLLEDPLRNGLFLCNLVDILTMRPVPGVVENVRSMANCIHNISIALDALAMSNVLPPDSDLLDEPEAYVRCSHHLWTLFDALRSTQVPLSPSLRPYSSDRKGRSISSISPVRKVLEIQKPTPIAQEFQSSTPLYLRNPGVGPGPF